MEGHDVEIAFDDDGTAFAKEFEHGYVIGTADYLAPEQVVDSRVDIRADIYSLGGSLYYLLVGKSPFQDGTVPQKMIWHQVRQAKPVAQFRDDVPADLLAVMDRMLAKDPARRYQEPIEVANALAPLVTQTPPAPTAQEMPPLIRAGLAKPSSQVSTPTATTARTPGSPPSANPGSAKMLPRPSK